MLMEWMIPGLRAKVSKLITQCPVITLSVGLSLEARKLFARFRSLLKLQNLFRLESTGGLVRSGESEGIEVFLIGDSDWVSRDELWEREEEVDDEEKNEEEEKDEGDGGIEEEVDVESNLTLLTTHTRQRSLTN